MCPVAVSVVLAFTIAMQEAKLEAQLAAYPPRDVVEAQIEFASIHEDYLIFMTEMLPSEKEYKILLDYHSQVHCYWLALQIAQDKMRSLSLRCIFLELLKESLDADTHLRGRMPPLVCIWRFRDGPPPLGCYPAPLHNKTGTGTVSNPEPQ
jgi:hypothetical protein